MLRQPLVVVVGNIDVGKTKMLDCIRKTAVVESEAGGITQMISSSSISLKTIEKICGDLLKGKTLSLPGLVFIDTPGHAAFSHLRRRGGSLADLAILVIDLHEGVKLQTEECLAILKQYKTPFVVALNKLDLTPGWLPVSSSFVLDCIQKQPSHVQQYIETRLYEIVGQLYGHGFPADRFDRIDDFTQAIALVPCSAKEKYGLPELLMVLIGLAQRYLESQLNIDPESPGEATVFEVKEEQGLGTTLDIILYTGKLQVNDSIMIGTLNDPLQTKVKGLFLPDDHSKFRSVKEVYAAVGVKVVGQDMKDVLAGMPLLVLSGDNEQEVKERILLEIKDIIIETEGSGVVIKAESLGSLEAVVTMVREKGIPIKRASIGPVNKKDILAAHSDPDPLNRVILCFNIEPEPSLEIKILSNNVIYQLIDDLEAWRDGERLKAEQSELKDLIRPAKVRFLPGCLFRQSNPCVIGVEILDGTLRQDVNLVKENGDALGSIKTIECEKESVPEAEKGKQVAISLPGVTGGRQAKEGEIYYVDMNEENFKELKRLKRFLSQDEVEVLKELAEIKRKQNNFWGV